MIESIALIFIALAGFAEAVMDITQFHFDRSIFSNKDKYLNEYWNPQDSWKNKWKNFDPKLGEKFKGSSTLFVFTTDAWHFFKFVRTSLLFIGLPLLLWNHTEWISLLGLAALARVVFGITFTLGFDKIFKSDVK